MPQAYNWTDNFLVSCPQHIDYMADSPSLAVVSMRDYMFLFGMTPPRSFPLFFRGCLFSFRAFYLPKLHPILDHFFHEDHVREVIIGISYNLIIIGRL